MISLIVAMDKNRLIGDGNSLPWHIPKDLKYFKEITDGNIVVMGRKTYESIKKPLKNRVNLILSKDEEFNPKWGLKLSNIESVISFANYCRKKFNKKTFIIGGAQVYNQFYSLCDRLYITYINKTYRGDTLFPIKFCNINEDFEISSRKIESDCEFIVMDRKGMIIND